MQYIHEISRALVLLIQLGFVLLPYKLSKMYAEKSGYSIWKVYLQTVLAIVVITVFMTMGLGKHLEDNDPVFGGGIEITDYKVPLEQQVKSGIFLFTVLITPTLFGVYYGSKNRS